ncbi:MAG TPA: YebC/PmpR family DNA-binding transcriptional regulator [Candidatus Omnitrophota bacterium]|nr:YebC/PmpR family DNA-binding transcriptional regulator [Candidatus Omnitrophota bacterium]
MSGHSKWASIKHKKAATDSKRGAAFTKVIREITAQAKAGGGNPETNSGLRAAMDRAKGINMPLTNIENAIKKGTGELPGVTYEQVTFDAYGPGGVALYIMGLTDNKNRTTAEVRNLLTKKGGSLAGPGATSYLFTKKGFISVPKSKVDEDKLMEIALEAGAEDIATEKEYYEITTDITSLNAVKEAIEKKNIPVESAEMTMLPSTTVAVTGTDATTLMGLMEALEDHEDIQNVYANFDISEEDMDKISGGA